MQQKVITNLEKARRLAFENFEDIVMEPEAVQILVHLFIHPGCKSDINLASFANGKSIPLADISSHIITAFPSQVAKYAHAKQVTRITGVDLLECFALDHVDAVEENIKHLMMEPSYALAHVLTIGKVIKVQHIEQRQLVTIEVSLSGKKIVFSHILVPSTLSVIQGQTVFHHFGVIVAVADSIQKKTLARNLQREQSQKAFLQTTLKQVLGKDIQDIDYAKEAFFKVDMTGKIIDQANQDVSFQKLWAEDDLQKIKIPNNEKKSAKGGSASGTKEKVMFQS